jgi:hypothetical protein
VKIYDLAQLAELNALAGHTDTIKEVVWTSEHTLIRSGQPCHPPPHYLYSRSCTHAFRVRCVCVVCVCVCACVRVVCVVRVCVCVCVSCAARETTSGCGICAWARRAGR